MAYLDDLKDGMYDQMVDVLTEKASKAETLLIAVWKLLQKQYVSSYVINILAETVFYDEAECDGQCLKEDIEYWFDEFSNFNYDEYEIKEGVHTP